MMRSVKTVLAAVERLPAVTLAIDDAQGSAGVRVGARLVARIDLRHGRALVNAPAVRVPKRVFPLSCPTANGIVVDLAESRGGSEALAAIRRRVNVERLVWQFRVASP